MVINIPEVEPFTFQASTAFDERVQLANKLNEVIDALNLVGDIPDMQTEIDGLKQSVASLQESIGSTDTNLETVEGKLNKAITDLNALTAKVGTIETTISGIQSDIAAIEGDISGLDSEVEGLKAEVVDEVSMASTSHGSVQVTIHHEDGTQDTSAPIDLALVQEGGITLQTGATDRSFNLKVTLSDGSSWQTNDFVIPEGGGTDVSVTSIQISQGTSANQIRVRIGLSDGSFINSNDWAVVTPAEFGTLQTTVQGATGDITSLEGRATALETQMDTVDTEISGLDDRVTALEGSPGYNLPVASAEVLGGVKIGGNITVQADGTISVPNATTSAPGVMTGTQVAQLNTAAVGSTVMFTGDASKVTLHVDSVAGSAFTEDVPAAADGGAGTIDQASYQKIASTEAALNSLTPTVTINDSVSPPTITVGINGKNASTDLPVTGEWVEIDPTNLPTDFKDGDWLIIRPTNMRISASSWNSTPSGGADTMNHNPFVLIRLGSINNDLVYQIYGAERQGSNSITLTSLENIFPYDNWNGTGSTVWILRLLVIAFNGTGLTTEEISISRDNASTYIREIYRLNH